MQPSAAAARSAAHAHTGAPAVLEAFDALRVAVTVFDAADRLIYCNRHFHYLFPSLPDHSALLGKTYSDLVRLEVACGAIAASETLEGLEGFVARRYAQLHGGEYKPLDVKLANGHIVEIKARRAANGGFVALWTDVTDLRRLAHSSAQTAAQRSAFLAELMGRLSVGADEGTSANFLRTMSNELKTPLNAIIGFADLLRADPSRFTSQQITDYAELIHAGGQNLLRLINQIMDLTKIAAGKFRLERAGVDAGLALSDARDAALPRASEKSIALLMEDLAGPYMVHADAMALRTMIRHLVENAVTFTQPRGEVRLSLKQVGGRVHITVADNGPGVDEAELRRILLPFEQGGARHHGHGAGLGLTLVKALAELHGGALSIESVLGEGFTATLELPVG